MGEYDGWNDLEWLAEDDDSGTEDFDLAEKKPALAAGAPFERVKMTQPRKEDDGWDEVKERVGQDGLPPIPNGFAYGAPFEEDGLFILMKEPCGYCGRKLSKGKNLHGYTFRGRRILLCTACATSEHPTEEEMIKRFTEREVEQKIADGMAPKVRDRRAVASLKKSVVNTLRRWALRLLWKAQQRLSGVDIVNPEVAFDEPGSADDLDRVMDGSQGESSQW